MFRRRLPWIPPTRSFITGLASSMAILWDSSNLAEAFGRRVEPRRSNPNKSDYWLTLASACESVRDNACADQALQRALVLSPMVPQVWWVAGNHYLRTDRPEAALPCFHRLLELSPDYAAPTFALTLRAYGNPKMILEKVVGDEKDPQAGAGLCGLHERE